MLFTTQTLQGTATSISTFHNRPQHQHFATTAAGMYGYH